MEKFPVVDCLQYANWSEEIFRQIRAGRWRKALPTSDVARTGAKFPACTNWFRSNEDFQGIVAGLRDVDFSEAEVRGIMAENCVRFFEISFGPAAS